MSRNYLCFKVDLSFERTQTGRPSRDRALFNSLNWLFSFFSFFFREFFCLVFQLQFDACASESVKYFSDLFIAKRKRKLYKPSKLGEWDKLPVGKQFCEFCSTIDMEKIDLIKITWICIILPCMWLFGTLGYFVHDNHWTYIRLLEIQ